MKIDYMNRLGNVKNPYQDVNVKKVLTVCSAGLLRSPTTAKVLAENYGFNTRSAGITKEYALIIVDEVLVYWADEIVFMQNEHLEMFKYMFKDSKIAQTMLEEGKYQVLNIPDAYAWNDAELVKLILEKYEK